MEGAVKGKVDALAKGLSILKDVLVIAAKIMDLLNR